jgi:hypothetical protein
MDPSEAGKIEAYFCEICTEVGAGVTRSESPVASIGEHVPSDVGDIRPATNSFLSRLAWGLSGLELHCKLLRALVSITKTARFRACSPRYVNCSP